MSWTIDGVNDTGKTFSWEIQSEEIIGGLQMWLSQPMRLATPVSNDFPETAKQFVDRNTKESIYVHRNWTIHVISHK